MKFLLNCDGKTKSKVAMENVFGIEIVYLVSLTLPTATLANLIYNILKLLIL